MNEAALRLLRSDPSLIRFQGSAIKTGPLIEAVKVVISASYDYARAGGSRSSGAAGQLGARASPPPKSKLES